MQQQQELDGQTLNEHASNEEKGGLDVYDEVRHRNGSDDQLCDAHHEMAQCADRIAVAAADAAYWLEAQGDRLPIALAELRIRVREYRKRQDRADRLHAEWEQVMGVER